MDGGRVWSIGRKLKDGELNDADIDAILNAGQSRTKTLNARYEMEARHR
jgi:hypothetical protein